MAQHLLLSYNKSFAAILRGQHQGKGVRWAGQPAGQPAAGAGLGKRRLAHPTPAGPHAATRPFRRPSPRPAFPCSGGAQAMTLLSSNPAVRELLVRPLAIRMVSLRRYIDQSMQSVGSLPKPPPAKATSKVTPEAMAAAAGPSAADLSGMDAADVDSIGALGGGAAAEAAERLEEEERPTRLQRFASTMQQVVGNSLAL